MKPEMSSGVRTRNGTPHDKYNIRGIAHVRTNRKDESLHVYWSGGKDLVKNQDRARPELTVLVTVTSPLSNSNSYLNKN